MRFDPSRWRSPWLFYGLAIVSVAAVTGLKFVIPKIGTDAPFVAMLAPALLSAWYGGIGPGLFAAVLGTASAHFLFLAPQFDFRSPVTGWFHTIVSGGMDMLAAALLASVRASFRKADVAARRIEGIYSVSSALGGTKSLQDVAEVVLHESVAMIGASGVAFFLTSERGNSLRLMAHLGSDPRLAPLTKLEAFKEMPLEEHAPTTLAARTRSLVFVESREEFRARFPDRAGAATGAEIPAAFAAAPMIVHGQVVGVLCMSFSKERRIGPEDRSWVQTLAQDCGMAVERSRLFERERTARVSAQEAARAKDEFLSVVSSELRGPLTTIVEWARLLLQCNPCHAKERARYTHGLTIIKRSARAQARLVEDILDMSRIVARKLTLDVKTVDLKDTVHACVENLRGKAAARGIELKLASSVDATVVADADRIRQAFRKVVENAFRSTQHGGHVEVELGV